MAGCSWEFGETKLQLHLIPHARISSKCFMDSNAKTMKHETILEEN